MTTRATAEGLVMSIKQMSAEDLKIKLDNGEDVVFIDCREQDEFDAGHIPMAQLIPLSVFEKESEKLLKNKDAEIIIGCRSGRRSQQACEILEKKGFNNLTNLSGGILEWMDNGFDVIRD